MVHLPPGRLTVHEFRALPFPDDDGARRELLDGRVVVTPIPRPAHQIVVRRLVTALANHIAPHGLDDCVLPGGDAAIDDGNLLVPDVMVVPPAELSRQWESIRTLLLAVEVVSPASARRDRVEKRRLYQRSQARTYWVVDVDAQLVEEWLPADERPRVVTEALRWRWEPAAPELVLPIDRLLGALPPA
ncbi:MAG: Uma2 family endonuclease [Gemmatimonadales bacterium]|nr:Uma2 family endonuclease [Gemmatimonadales bacterium]